MITLTIICIFIITMIIIEKNSKTKNKNKTNNIHTQVNVNTENNYNKIYEKKRYITTLKEVEFYNILQDITNKYDLLVFSQVVLYELVNIKISKYDKEYLKYWNKIASKSIDFVIVNKKTTKILMCIELDDNTHNNQKRIERDKFINELFQAIQVPLLRISTNKPYNKEFLEKNIKENCTDLIY